MTTRRYAVKEIFDSIQGEGSRAGERSIFLRLAGCNLWSGTEETRALGRGACAAWCDTNFVDPLLGKLSGEEILAELDRLWPSGERRWVVITGGEPALQLDEALFQTLDKWWIAVETNGTVEFDDAFVDHVCVSPKVLRDSQGDALTRIRSMLRIRTATELKVVLTPEWKDDMLEALDHEDFSWLHRYVQPVDGEGREESIRRCVEWVRRYPEWRISVQTHKVLGLR